MKLRKFVCRLHSRLQFKGAVCRKYPISMGSNGRLKPRKLLHLIEHIGNKTTQDSFQYYCFDVDGAIAYQTEVLFWTYPVQNVHRIDYSGRNALTFKSYGRKVLEENLAI